MDFIKNILETIYDLVMSILKSSGVDVLNFPADLFPAAE